MKALVIGEAPGVYVAGAEPLTGTVASKIIRYAGISMNDYLSLTERTNLFRNPVTRWHNDEAMAAAEGIREQTMMQGQRVVLLGVRVATAFGVKDLSLYKWHDHRLPFGGHAYVIRVPHPSGRNLLLNDPKERERFGIAFVSALDL